MKKLCLFIIIGVVLTVFSGAEAAALIMKLIKAGPTSAVVEYKGQKITVRKYYPKEGSLIGGSTDMGLLTPCIGYQVGAIVDDRNGEILGLWCPGKNVGMARSLSEGNIKGAVLVVPDEYVNLR
jgi:hypothetical protein